MELPFFPYIQTAARTFELIWHSRRAPRHKRMLRIMNNLLDKKSRKAKTFEQSNRKKKDPVITGEKK